MNKLDATLKIVCIATLRDKYHTKMCETLVDYNHCNNAPLSNENLQQAISIVIAEEELDECNLTLDAHNMTMDTFCQSPVTTNTQGDNANTILTSERIKNSAVLAKMLKVLTINDDAYYNSDENYAEGNPASDPKVDTHTSDGRKGKLLTLATEICNKNY